MAELTPEEKHKRLLAFADKLRAENKGKKPVVDKAAKTVDDVRVPVSAAPKATRLERLAGRVGKAIKEVHSKTLGKKYEAAHADDINSPIAQRRIKIDKARVAAKKKKKENAI